MFIPVIALCIWLPIIYMAIGSAYPGLIAYWIILLFAEILSLGLYFKWPWISIVVSWGDMTGILLGVIPWKGHSVHAFMEQFGFDLMYFALAHIGFIAWKVSRAANANLNERRVAQV
jgi:hypothetical protein